MHYFDRCATGILFVPRNSASISRTFSRALSVNEFHWPYRSFNGAIAASTTAPPSDLP
jgi:hypothetical protein